MNEIDPKMAECYIANHNPKYSYIEPIQEFKLRDDLPEELYNLTILDGSPPCSSFSMAGNREKDWGKDKKFREGQAEQVLDTLFFDFIDVAEKLQPKIVIAENVKGLLLGDAIKYVKEIYKAFDKAGYYVEKWLLDASTMGVPQRRERVFFLAMRKDICDAIGATECVDMFNPMPWIDMTFKEFGIKFSRISDEHDETVNLPPRAGQLWEECKQGFNLSSVPASNGSFFNDVRVAYDKVLPTLAAQDKVYHAKFKRKLNNSEYAKATTFPTDYNFISKSSYICGMSVPPLMTAQIATRIKQYWLSQIKPSPHSR
jgi:DNA (cytosine-5)-methyltransferase 1